MAYKLLKNSSGVFRLADSAFIPNAADNSDWKRYQDWLALGNTPQPVDPDPPPTQDQLDAAAAKAYAKLAAMMAMTPAQIATWVDGNVTNLSQAQDAIKTLAVAVSVLARRL